MHEIGAFDAKTHLSQLLERVRHGESFAITRHGKVIALLVPSEAKPHLEVSDAISGIIALRKRIATQGIKVSMKDLQKMKAAGRK